MQKNGEINKDILMYIFNFIEKKYKNVSSDIVFSMAFDIFNVFEERGYLSNNIINGNYDNYINQYVINTLEKNGMYLPMKQEAQKYIIKCLDGFYNSYNGEKNHAMLEEMIKDIPEQIGTDYKDILSGKKYLFIKNIAYNYMNAYSKEIVLSKNKNYVYKYMNKHVAKLSFLNIYTDKEKKKIATEVALRISYDTDELYKLSSIDDDLIVMMVREACRGTRSYKKGLKKENPIRYGKNKMIIAQRICSLLLAGAMTISGFIISKNIKKHKVLSTVDPFEYSQVYTTGSEHFKETADHLFESYDSFCNVYNHNFGFLAFYQAYDNVYGFNRLALMDRYMNYIKQTAIDRKEYYEISSEISLHYSFVEYAYDLVVSSGNHRVDSAKYKSAVQEYVKYAKMLNTSLSLKNGASNGTPFELLSEENQIYIEDIMKEYRDYCNKQTNQLVKLVERNGDIKAYGRS